MPEVTDERLSARSQVVWPVDLFCLVCTNVLLQCDDTILKVHTGLQSIPRQIAESPACDVLEMLHSWWLAECHLDRLQSQHKLKTQVKWIIICASYWRFFAVVVFPLTERAVLGASGSREA